MRYSTDHTVSRGFKRTRGGLSLSPYSCPHPHPLISLSFLISVPYPLSPFPFPFFPQLLPLTPHYPHPCFPSFFFRHMLFPTSFTYFLISPSHQSSRPSPSFPPSPFPSPCFLPSPLPSPLSSLLTFPTAPHQQNLRCHRHGTLGLGGRGLWGWIGEGGGSTSHLPLPPPQA